MQTQMPPWHMWGSSEVVRAISSNTQVFATKQLARISYARPETWRFLFWAQLVESNQDDGDVVIVYDLQIGVGRSMVTLNRFGRFEFVWAGGFNPALNNGFLKWSTEFRAPITDDSDATSLTPLIETISAQDIQVTTRVQMLTESTSAFVRVEVGTFFTPQVHVRPEWSIHEFPGNEQKGK